MPKLPFALCIGACAALALPVPAAAAPAEAERASESGKPVVPDRPARVSLKDATAIVRQAYGGRVLSATVGQRRGADGKAERGYRLRVDVNGTVKTVFVDARGRIHES